MEISQHSCQPRLLEAETRVPLTALSSDRCHQQRCGPCRGGCETARVLAGSVSDEALRFVMQAPSSARARGFFCSRREVLLENKYGSKLSLGLIFMKALLTEIR